MHKSFVCSSEPFLLFGDVKSFCMVVLTIKWHVEYVIEIEWKERKDFARHLISSIFLFGELDISNSVSEYGLLNFVKNFV